MTLSLQAQADLARIITAHNVFPPIPETIAYADGSGSLSAERHEAIDKLYKENPDYRAVVDDWRKHRRHYEGNGG